MHSQTPLTTKTSWAARSRSPGRRGPRAVHAVAALLALTASACKVECEHGGRSYAEGEQYKDPDGCNTCTCTVEGSVCTVKMCTSQAEEEDAALPLTSSCEEQTAESSHALHAALSDADRRCASDDDCTLYYLGSDCYAGCGAVLSVRGAAALEELASEHATTECHGFTAKGCKLIVPPCVALGAPLCVAGACRELTVDGDDSSISDAGIADGGSTTPAPSPILLNRAHAGGTILARVGQPIELTLQTVGPGRYGAPTLSSSAVRFVDVTFPPEQNPGGPRQRYRFEAIREGSAALTIPHESSAPERSIEPFTLLIEVR